jgi:hypothetical protein
MNVDVNKWHGEVRSRGFGKGSATTVYSGVQGHGAPRIRASPKGERGAFLRREGLYSSHINTWRSERTERDLKGASAAPAWAETKKRSLTPR